MTEHLYESIRRLHAWTTGELEKVSAKHEADMVTVEQRLAALEAAFGKTS